MLYITYHTSYLNPNKKLKWKTPKVTRIKTDLIAESPNRFNFEFNIRHQKVCHKNEKISYHTNKLFCPSSPSNLRLRSSGKLAKVGYPRRPSRQPHFQARPGTQDTDTYRVTCQHCHLKECVNSYNRWHFPFTPALFAWCITLVVRERTHSCGLQSVYACILTLVTSLRFRPYNTAWFLP